jgi:ankyrin repeat protein
MESLIQAYPDALLITEDKGWTPLHYACRSKASKDVVQLLLHMYPEKGRVGVSRPDRQGRLPLYYAVRYSAPSGVVNLLLEMDPSAVLEEDQNAHSPLALTWDDWAEKTGGRRDIRKILVGEEVSESSDFLMNSISTIYFESSEIEDCIEKAKAVRRRLQRQTDALQRWNKVKTFLKAAFGFPLDEGCDLDDDTRLEEEEKKSTQEEPKWRVLHAVSAIKCHSSLFLLAVCLHPEQAFEMDRNDLRRIDNIYKSEDCNEMNPLNISALHLAASSHASGESGKRILTQLLALNPAAASCVDSEGSTPLHRISGNKSKQDWNLDAVENIYSCYKDAKTTIDANGRLPLHRASNAITYFHSNIQDDAVMSRSKICRLLHEHADAASHPDHFGCLPIHLVAQNGRSWDVQVQSLYEANIAGVRVRAGVKFFNRLPLHIAAANANSDFSMVRTLLKYNPLGASQVDRKGLFALHLACESGHSWEIVNSIHQAFPGAVEEVEDNSRGWNTLHMAAYSNHSDGELVSELVKLCPNAASACDNNDRYPLHLACMSGKVWEDGLSCLFEANPNAIRCRDKKGLLPLHIVAFRNCSKPPAVCDSCPKITNRSSRRSKSLIASEFDRLTKNEKKEAQELSNIFEILKSDPTALLM